MRPEVLTVPVLSVSVPGDWPHSPSFALRQQWDENTLGWNNRHKLPEGSAKVQGSTGTTQAPGHSSEHQGHWAAPSTKGKPDAVLGLRLP